MYLNIICVRRRHQLAVWTILELYHKRVRLMTLSPRHSSVVHRINCFHVFLDLQVPLVVDMIPYPQLAFHGIQRIFQYPHLNLQKIWDSLLQIHLSVKELLDVKTGIQCIPLFLYIIMDKYRVAHIQSYQLSIIRKILTHGLISRY